ncbi:MAG: helix-turn-helix transcriptional regulator [Clostridia bacterium]|nr:helix-turn-helix transcriptional regulator [Clostridia bacterium]
MSVSELVIKEIISIYTVDRSIGEYSVVNRPYSAFCIKMSGNSSYSQDGREYVSDDRHVIFIPQLSTYTYSVLGQGSCVIIEFISENAPKTIKSYSINEGSVIKAIISTMEYTWRLKRTGYRENCFSGIYQLMYHIVLNQNNTYIPKVHQMRITRSIQYLHEHFCDHNLAIESIAEQSDVSAIYFRRLFTEIYGLSPKKYIIMMRINRAKELLDPGMLSISEIAERVGFGDVYSFCKAFRKEVGSTPTEYKKRLRDEDSSNIPGS